MRQARLGEFHLGNLVIILYKVQDLTYLSPELKCVTNIYVLLDFSSSA